MEFGLHYTYIIVFICTSKIVVCTLLPLIFSSLSLSLSLNITNRADESSENLARWTKRWDDSNTGWHKSQPHHFLQKHGHHIVPNFVPEAENGGTCDGNQTRTPVRVFVPLCGKVREDSMNGGR